MGRGRRPESGQAIERSSYLLSLRPRSFRSMRRSLPPCSTKSRYLAGSKTKTLHFIGEIDRMIDRMNERLRFALWVAITEHPSGEADWRDPTGHAVVPPGGSKVAAGTRSGHQYRTPLPGRVPPEEMLAHAGSRMMSRFQRSGRCGKSTVRMYPR